MAHLSIVGSHSINGVSAMHSRLVRNDAGSRFPRPLAGAVQQQDERRHAAALAAAGQSPPGRTHHQDTSVTPGLPTSNGSARLEQFANDSAFRQEFGAIKRANKERLARVIEQSTSIRSILIRSSMFRSSAFTSTSDSCSTSCGSCTTTCASSKTAYSRRSPNYVFAGKAAPGYWAAKQIIKLICSVGSIVNDDPRANGHIKVVFVPDFRVSLAEIIIPAADLSEQISTAGSEASGTGNMKLAMNGALTIGTLDGANVEILEAVGAENMFIFGLTADRIQALRSEGSYRPRDLYEQDARVRRILDALDSTLFSPGEPGLFHWIVESILDGGDAISISPTCRRTSRCSTGSTTPSGNRHRDIKAILNVARIGRFSSDRTVAEYARDIWGIVGVK